MEDLHSLSGDFVLGNHTKRPKHLLGQEPGLPVIPYAKTLYAE